MILASLMKGCLIGFSIAMPVGPIGLLCIKNSLNRGMAYGLSAGLGAALADTLFGILGGLGFAAINKFIADYHMYLEAMGVLFLLYLGIKTFTEKVGDKVAEEYDGGYGNVFISTFFLTLTNPLTVLSFVGVFAGLGAGQISNDLKFPLIIAFGVFIGSALWWLLLSFGSSCFKKVLSHNARRWVNRLSGSILLLVGVIGAVQIFREFYA